MDVWICGYVDIWMHGYMDMFLQVCTFMFHGLFDVVFNRSALLCFFVFLSRTYRPYLRRIYGVSTAYLRKKAVSTPYLRRIYAVSTTHLRF